MQRGPHNAQKIEPNTPLIRPQKYCEACNQPLPMHGIILSGNTASANGASVTFGHVQLTFFRALLLSSQPLSKEQLADYIWGSHTPHSYLNCLSVTAYHVRRKLEPLGYTVKSFWAGGPNNCHYQLSPLDTG